MKRAMLTMAVVLIAVQCFAQDSYNKAQERAKPLTIWDTVSVPTAEISISSRTVLKAPKKLLSLVFAPDGRLAANSSDEVYVWSPAGKLVKILPVQSESISFSHGGRYLVTSFWEWNNGGKMTAWDMADWTDKAQAMGLCKGIGAPASSLVATWCPWEDDLVIWNIETDRKHKVWSGPHGKVATGSVFQPYTWESVTSASFSPDGRFIALARLALSGDQLVIVDTDSGHKVRSFFNCSNKSNILRWVEYSADGHFLVTHGDYCDILVREANTEITLGRFKNEPDNSTIPHFTPDGRYVFFFDRKGGHFRRSDGSKGGLDIATARQADTASGTECKLEITEENLADAISPTFSPDGKYMAWIEGNNIHIWTLQGVGPVSMH
jgi:WD40 repeat protein